MSESEIGIQQEAQHAAAIPAAANGHSKAAMDDLALLLPAGAEDPASNGMHYHGWLGLEELPVQYHKMVRFPGRQTAATAYIVGAGQHHIIVHDGKGGMGILVLPEESGNEHRSFVASMRERGHAEIVRNYGQPIAYAVPPYSRDSCTLSTLAGYFVESFFPLHGKPGEEARPALEAALVNPHKSLEAIMASRGFAVHKL